MSLTRSKAWFWSLVLRNKFLELMRDIKWVKNIRRTDGGWAYEHDMKLLHWSDARKWSAETPISGDLMLLFQRVNDIVYLTHIVEFIDDNVVLDSTNPGYKWARKIKVVAQADPINNIPNENFNFGHVNMGHAISFTNLRYLNRNEPVPSEAIWELFKSALAPTNSDELDEYLDRFNMYLITNSKPNYYRGLAKALSKYVGVELEKINSNEVLNVCFEKIEAYSGEKYSTRYGKDNLRTIAKLIFLFNTKKGSLEADIEDIKNNTELSSTQKETLIYARLGQGKYRNDLIDLYTGKCVISGIDIQPILIASHIKAWSHCKENSEKLSKYNGLLLSANYDKLFDRNFISFDNEGNILISKRFSETDLENLGLSSSIKIKLHDKSIPFMEYQRNIFENLENELNA